MPDVEMLKRLARLLDDRLAGGEAESRLVSKLAAGSAFEAWLSFETRLLAEENRELLGLSGHVNWPGGDAIHRYYFANEYRKVDLYIGDLGSDGSDGSDAGCVAAVEFKLVYNNKNWKSQADGIWVDLFPSPETREIKAGLNPLVSRAAIVAFVGKSYRDNSDYPVVPGAFADWESNVDGYLLGEEGWEGKHIDRQWSGRRFSVRNEWLDATNDNFFQLHLFLPRK